MNLGKSQREIEANPEAHIPNLSSLMREGHAQEIKERLDKCILMLSD